MNAPYYVEVLHRNKEVRHRYRLDALPIRLGRGYDNTVILDDPHTSAHHAIIDRADDGGLTVQDLDSRNGIIHKGRRHKELSIDGGTIFRLGHTSLRVRSSDFPVEGETAAGRFYDWEGWRPAAVGLTLLMLLAVVETWVGDSEKFELTRYLLAMVITLGLGMFWCGSWSFANRLFGGNARLGRHLFIFGCGIALLQVLSLVNAVIAYAFSFEGFTRYDSHAMIALLAAMVFYHLLQIRPARSRLFAVVSIALALFGSALMLMFNHKSDGRLADELYMSEHFPPAVRVSSDRPVAHFIASAAKLKTIVDSERTNLVSDEEDSKDQD